jgi:hypothetical protein
MAHRQILTSAGVVIAVALAIAGTNYVNLQRPLSQVLDNDPRNKDIKVSAHYQYFVNPNVLVYDLRDVPGSFSPADITRVMLQFAEQIKDRQFDNVELNHRGHEKFVLKGDYFKKLGEEYGSQNPIYTFRTLPENLYKPDGKSAYGTWTGGLLGVLTRQMDDFTNFHHSWYIDDLVSER